MLDNSSVINIIVIPPNSNTFSKRECVICSGSKLTNFLGKLELSTTMSSCHAPWNRGKFVCKPASSEHFLQLFFYFQIGRYNKTLNNWYWGNIEGLREIKLTVSVVVGPWRHSPLLDPDSFLCWLSVKFIGRGWSGNFTARFQGEIEAESQNSFWSIYLWVIEIPNL